MENSPWTTVDQLHTWLGGSTTRPAQEETLLRILKLSEEVGEVAQAVIGVTGQNPRKGVTHGWQDVRAELCDVIVTAMVALRTLTPDAGEVFAAHLERVAERSLGGLQEYGNDRGTRQVASDMTTNGRPEVLRYTAFSADPAGGNPAGVVLDASGLDDAEQLAIAAELGYSETAFLTAPPEGLGGTPGRAFTVRYFSPRAEVPFCGHATVATAIAFAERHGPGDLLLATRAGTVPVTVTEEDGTFRATLTSVEPAVLDAGEKDVARALEALGWSAADLDPALPPRIGYAGARHLILAAATRSRLADLSYDFDALTGFMHQLDLTTLQLVWRESETVFHVRDPFPVGGVVEDPATGAAAAAFGAYARELGLVPAESVLTLHQGVDMGRPGELRVELRRGDARVRVAGTGARVPQDPAGR